MTANQHLGERVYELASGTLRDQERTLVEDHVVECPQCAEELRETRAALTLLALELTPIAPRPGTLDTIRASINRDQAQPGDRFDEFADSVAELYGVTPARARELLRYLDEASRWSPGPAKGSEMMLVQPGPAYAGHFTMFIRVRAGTVFPWHEHQGDEHFVVLQGSCTEPDGTVFRPGSVAHHSTGTAHDFTVLPDGPAFIFAVRIAGGIRVVPRPTSPK